LEKPEHRTPVPIVWHADSGTFFVGTFHDGSIYRGDPEDPTVRVFLEGQTGVAGTSRTNSASASWSRTPRTTFSSPGLVTVSWATTW
jgi:hypothetical protein